MKARSQKRYLIISVLLACVFCIVGLFLVFKNDRKSGTKTITASAVSSDSEQFYFEAGAAIQTNTLEFNMRFTLKIHQDVHDGLLSSVDDWFITVEAPMSDSIQFMNGEDHTYWYDNSVTRVRYYNDDIYWSDDGWGTLYIILSVDYITEVDLEATLCEDYTIGYGVHETAYSDARSYSYIYDKYMESGSSGATVTSNVRAEQWDAYLASVDKTALSIGEKAWLDSYNGLSFILNVPQDYLNLIAQGEVLATNESDRKVYEQYMLVEMNVASGFDLASKAFDPSYDGIIAVYKDVPNCFNSGTTALIKSLQLWEGNRVFGVVKKERVQVAKTNTVYAGQTYYGNWQDESETYTAIDWTDKICSVDFSALASEILSSTDLELTESEMLWLQDLGGVAADTVEVQVNLVYQYLSDPTDPSSITTKTGEYFKVKSVYAFSKTFVANTMYQLKDYTGIDDFNVHYYGSYYEYREDEKKYVHATEQRTILQAKDLTYKYDAATQTGTLTVNYEEFRYSNFGMRVVNNDRENNLELMYYPTSTPDVSGQGLEDVVVADDGSVTIRFRYNAIRDQIRNCADWCSDITKANIQFTNNNDPEVCTVTVGTDMVEVWAANQDYLKNVSLRAVATLIDPNTEIDINCKYVDLYVDGSGKLVEEVKTSETKTMIFGNYVGLASKIDNVTNWFPEISAGVECDVITGTYMKPVTVHEIKVPTGGTEGDYLFTLEVGYNYNTMFEITNTYDDTVLYKVLNDVSTLYYGEFFVDTIPTSWRVKAINAVNDDVRITVDEDAPDDYKKTKIEVLVDANEHHFISIEVDMTDKWDLIINYFEMYKETPFAIKTQASKEIRVLDYPDVYKLTDSDLAAILGKQNMVVGIGHSNVNVESIKVTFDGVSTYTADISYGYETFRVNDYDGNTKEIKVPLISYAEWMAGFGQDWSILYLNEGEDRHYFDFSTDVAVTDLYGFFFVAVFEEQVSDFNRLFRNMNSEGEVTIFDERTVKGSAFYEFSYNLYNSKDIGDKLIGYVCMTFCEILDDENQMLYSYFGYLDGTSEYAYMSNGGGDDAFDDDTAFDNAMQDVGDGVNDLWDKITDKGESVGDWFKSQWDKFRAGPWDTVVVVVLCVIGGVLVIGLGWKYGKRYYLWVTAKPKTAPKKSTSKKKTTKKTTAKGAKK